MHPDVKSIQLFFLVAYYSSIAPAIGNLRQLGKTCLVLILFQHRICSWIRSPISWDSYFFPASAVILSGGNNLFSGTLPDELTRLATLQELVLGQSLLSGPIPDNIGHLDSLGMHNSFNFFKKMISFPVFN